MSFAQYLKVLLKKDEAVFEADTTSPAKEQALDFKKIESEIVSKVGGSIDEEVDKKTSFEALKQVLEIIPLEYFENPDKEQLDEIFKLLIDPKRFDFLEKYIDLENQMTRAVLNELNMEEGMVNPIKFNVSLSKYITLSERLLKIHRLLAGQVGGNKIEEAVLLDAETEQKIKRLVSELEKTILESNQKFNKKNSDRIKNLPDSPEGEEAYYKYKDLLQLTGLTDLFKEVLKAKEEKIKIKDSTRTQSELILKKKKRILERLINSIKLGSLPSIKNGEVSSEGDHFKLFKTLEKKNKAWMDTALIRFVFNEDSSQYGEFNINAREKESALEKDQLAYLRANRSWIRTYIESSTSFLEGADGTPLTAEFLEKDSTSLKTSLINAVSDREKEIKNYYLSRDFNLGNFAGVQIKPEIKLPLHQRVKLAITEEDLKKESPLRGILSGMGKVVTGLFGAIPDKSNTAVAAAARKRNLAVLNGLNAIVKGTVGLVGGKQAARDYDKEVTSKLPGKKEKGVKEDMISMADSPGAMVVNPEAPGQSLQTPHSLPGNNMDTFSLAGPLQKPWAKSKKKKKSKKSSDTKLTNRVSSFSDFMKRK